MVRYYGKDTPIWKDTDLPYGLLLKELSWQDDYNVGSSELPDIYEPGTNIVVQSWLRASNNIHPYTHGDVTCAAILLVQQPMWVNIPCNIPVASEWFCKVPQHHKTQMLNNGTSNKHISIYSCPDDWYQVGNVCYGIVLLLPTGTALNRMCSFDDAFPALASHDESSLFIDTLISENIHFESGIIENSEVVLYIDPHGNNFTSVLCMKHPSLSNCHAGYFRCDDYTCIPESFLCDGFNDCTRGEDEAKCHCLHFGATVYDSHFCTYNCHANDYCQCEEIFHQGTNGGCVVYQDNRNAQDDQVYHCDNGDTILAHYVNDFIPDCSEGEDEAEYKAVLLDYSVDGRNCTPGMLPCYKGHSRCFSMFNLCVYDFDKNGRLQHCGNGGHLLNCEQFPCANSYKCQQSYCIPYRRVCDGRADCPGGDDDDDCEEYVCAGMVKCRGTTFCVHSSEVCDGITHCPLGDDEMLCSRQPCPVPCQCLGLAVICDHTNMTILPYIGQNVQYMKFTGHSLTLTETSFSDMMFLEHLSLADNGIRSICGSSQRPVFSILKYLQTLDLRENSIMKLVSFCFNGTRNITRLYLQNNEICMITKDTFHGLNHLHTLNMSFNKMVHLNLSIFKDLNNLIWLDVRGNSLLDIESSMSDIFHSLNILLADDSRMCCLVPKSATCVAPVNFFSSCNRLLGYKYIVIWLWLIIILTTLCNLLVLIYKIQNRHRSSQDIFIISLSASDLLFGIFLFIIGISDFIYDGDYALHDNEWKSSIFCHAAAVISAISSLMSCFNLCALTCIRYYVIHQNEKGDPFSKSTISKVAFIAWSTVSLVTVSVILIHVLMEDFPRQSNVMCLNFVLDFNVSAPQISFSIFFNVFLTIAILLIITMYGKLISHIKSSRDIINSMNTTSVGVKMEIVSMRIIFITMTNLICWMPILIVGIVSLTRPLPAFTMAIIATIAMPINPAVNPIIYTFFNSRFRQWIKSGGKM